MGRVGVPTLTEDRVVFVASELDLLGTKLKVIMQRAESKDYSDIAELLRGGASLTRGLGAARSLYGSAFAPAECLRALTFFDDGDLAKVNTETRAVLRTEAASASKVFPFPSMKRRAAINSVTRVSCATHIGGETVWCSEPRQIAKLSLGSPHS